VGDEDDGFTELREELFEFGLELSADERVERAEGFIEEEDFGVEYQGAHEGDALALAAAELCREAVERVLGKVDHGGERGDAFGKLGCGLSGPERGELDIAPRGHVREEAAGLDGVSEAATDAGEVGLGKVLAVELDAALVRLDEADHEAEEGGLAAAGGTDEGGGGGSTHLERHTGQGGVLAEALGCLDDREHGPTLAICQLPAHGLLHIRTDSPQNARILPEPPTTATLSPLRILLKVIGPGVLLAGAAIGVSHLVQATRAGAEFRFGLLPLLLIACATKYPFLEFGPRYAAATGKTLIDGYRDLGRWALWTTLAVTIGSMFIIMAAVTIVTAVLAAALFGSQGIQLGVTAWSGVILGLCMVLLLIGRYPTLDLTMKLVMALLLLSTVAAVVAAIVSPNIGITDRTPPSWLTLSSFGFLLAFMGWMPIPIDSAIWHSIWTRERCKQTGHECTVRQARADFNFGYGLATAIAILFLTLGALVMFGSGEAFAEGGAGFATQFIDVYATTLGPWARPIISIAAFTTMLSTTLVVLDAFPRVMQRLLAALREREESRALSGRHYAAWVVVQAGFGLGIIAVLSGQLKTLVDLATTLSFLTAPVLAYINYRVITGPTTPLHARPGKAMRAFCVVSMVFLGVFSVAWVVSLVWRVVG